VEYNTDTLHDIMNKMVPGLAGGKMSASDPNSKIDLLDAPDVSARKIKKANAPPKVVEENGLLAFVENVLLPASSLLDGERSFKVEREGAEPLVYNDVEGLRKDYVADVVCFLTSSKMIIFKDYTNYYNSLLLNCSNPPSTSLSAASWTPSRTSLLRPLSGRR